MHQFTPAMFSKGVLADVGADADAVTIGFQDDTGALLVDVSTSNMEELDKYILALIVAKHDHVAARGQK